MKVMTAPAAASARRKEDKYLSWARQCVAAALPHHRPPAAVARTPLLHGDADADAPCPARSLSLSLSAPAGLRQDYRALVCICARF